MIRPGGAADIATIRTLRRAYLAEAAGSGWQPRLDDAAWEAWLPRRVAAGDVRVGIVEGRLAAYITWEVRADGGARRLCIDELYVAPSERGQHLGSGLLARALDRGRLLALPEAVLLAATDEAGGLPAQFGFTASDGALVCSLELT